MTYNDMVRHLSQNGNLKITVGFVAHTVTNVQMNDETLEYRDWRGRWKTAYGLIEKGN